MVGKPFFGKALKNLKIKGNTYLRSEAIRGLHMPLQGQ